MAGLTQKDLNILAVYADQDNRELYFNYLAQKEGNDGYGLLALGVVRNDNAPGATANQFAQNQARRDGLNYGEREWQQFGAELIKNDLALRQAQFSGDRADLALNLPVKSVQQSHDVAFNRRQINPDAWTPRQLLEAARRHGGEPEAEKVWSMMLDNKMLGVTRGVSTTEKLAYRYNDEQLDATSYLASMGTARTSAGLSPTPNTDPNIIALDGKEYSFHAASGGWRGPAPIESRIPVKIPVSDPKLIDRLDDAREVRLERQQLRTQFHPDDPYRDRPIKVSPWLLSDAAPAQHGSDEVLHARQPPPVLDPMDVGHPRHTLHQQCVSGVRTLDAKLGREYDERSACMAASLTQLAADNGLQRVDHVLLSGKGTDTAPGQYVFAVQGDLGNPAHLRAHMTTEQAINTPAAQSFQRLNEHDQQRGYEQLTQRQQAHETQQRNVSLIQA